MSKDGSKWLFLAIGAALGAAVGFVAATDQDKKDEWIRDIHGLASKVKNNAKCVAEKGRDKYNELRGNINEEIADELDGE